MAHIRCRKRRKLQPHEFKKKTTTNKPIEPWILKAKKTRKPGSSKVKKKTGN